MQIVMKRLELYRQRGLRLAQSLALALGLGGLALYSGIFAFGRFGPWLLLAQALAFAFIALRRSAPAFGRRYRRVDYEEAPWLGAVVAELSRRAGLARRPALYLLDAGEPNAAAFVHGGRASLYVTTGLAAALDREELAGVLAHELAHIKNKDLRLLALAGAAHEFTSLVGQLGWMLLFIFPLGLGLSVAARGLLPVALFLASPLLALALRMSLSRAREFAADLTASELLGSPRPLASALARLEGGRRSWLGLVFPYASGRAPSAFDSHPASAERIRRLMALERASGGGLRGYLASG